MMTMFEVHNVFSFFSISKMTCISAKTFIAVNFDLCVKCFMDFTDFIYAFVVSEIF